MARLCGCWYPSPGGHAPSHLPLHSMKSHTVIRDVASRTVLTQTFYNNSHEHQRDIVYSFPLYDGVSVVSFAVTIGGVYIHSIVKEKQQARREYYDSVNKDSSAGLLEQLSQASDVFVANVGNVPTQTRVIVEVEYIGELRHDAESNGIRFTIPTSIAPRYGATPNRVRFHQPLPEPAGRIHMVVDFHSPDGYHIERVQSPSHSSIVHLGRTTDMPSSDTSSNRASLECLHNTSILGKDFVVIATIKDAAIPKALLETHATIPHQRALMATLVPRFSIPPTFGEIVFIVDRSDSMHREIKMLKNAMTILLKSLPFSSGIKFNICSFGSRCSFLWSRSQQYDETTLSDALTHVNTFEANLGGTEMQDAVEQTLSPEKRFSDMLLDVIILTDGEIWKRDSLFDLVGRAAIDHKCRFFSLGIGSGASTALVEGIATAGNGFSQFVIDGERMDAKLVRLLKGALTPHIDDYSLEVKYKREDEEFEIIETAEEASMADITPPTPSTDESALSPISFFNYKSGFDDASLVSNGMSENTPAHLPLIPPPSVLQAPCRLPPLYPFSRTTVYLLLDPTTYHKTPEAVILRATCSQGPPRLEIKVEDTGKGEVIHQLAAKKAVSEIERDGGWLASATDKADGAQECLPKYL